MQSGPCLDTWQAACRGPSARVATRSWFWGPRLVWPRLVPAATYAPGQGRPTDTRATEGRGQCSVRPGPSRGPHRGEAGRDPRGVAASLTIMFSRACLASQQFRNTGMNRFRSGAQNICGGHGSGAGAGAAAPASGGRQRTHRDDEGESVDHLQDEGHLEDLLPDVALEATGSGDGEGDRPAQARGQAKGWAQAGGLGRLLCS